MKHLLLAFSLALLYPVKSLHVNHQSLRALNIQVIKTEPPRIAFEEVLEFIDSRSSVTSVEYPKQSVVINLNEQETQILDTPRNVVKLKAMKFDRGSARDAIAKIEQQENWISQLPQAQKRILAQARTNTDILERDWNVPDWRDFTEAQIQIAKNEIAEDEKQKVSYQKVLIFNPEQPNGSTNTASVDLDRNPVKPNNITGNLYFQGLPSTGVTMDLFREEDFQRFETGSVNLAQATFQINVHEREGHIRGILKDLNGNKIGEGRINLSAQLDTLNLYPVADTVSGQVAALGSRKTSAGEKVNTLFASTREEVLTRADGYGDVQNFSSYGWTFVRTEGGNFAPTISLWAAGTEQKKSLLRKSMVEALRSIVSEQKNFSDVAENGSVVWGQVLMDNKPQAGVALSVEGFENYRIIYFNALMLPDQTLSATSTNGFYAILDLPEGAHNILGKVNNIYFAHENIVVEPEVITLADVRTSMQKEQINLKTFDAFTGENEVAQVELQSQEEPIMLEGSSKVYLPTIRRLSFARVTPNDSAKAICLHTYSDDDRALLFPTVNEEWVRNIKSSRKISDAPGTGAIIGFVAEDDFEVALSYEDNYDPMNIAFFDAKGSATDIGTAGGGFILFNVPYGMQSVLVHSLNSGLRNSQLIPVDQGYLSLLQFRFY